MSKRRSGLRPPELRGTLGTLLRTTLQQAGAVREAFERSARHSRSRLDELRVDRKREEAFAELGELVFDLIEQGEIDIEALPEAHPILERLAELSRDLPEDPEPASAPAATGPERGEGRELDGTVSSATWAPPRRRAKPTDAWRPHGSYAGAPLHPPAEPEPPDPRQVAPAARATEPRKGGIQFDDPQDDDLADYMHPDDVPPKPGA